MQVIKQPRGMLRRCLLFDEAKKDVPLKNISHSTSRSGLFSSSEKLERLDFHKGRSISRKKQVESPLGQITTGTNFHPRGAGKVVLSTSKPFGIGLHLNSVFKGQQMGETTTASMELSETKQSIQEVRSAFISDVHMLDNQKSFLVPSNVVEKDTCAEEEKLNFEASIVCASPSLDSSILGETPDFLMQMEPRATNHRRKFSSEHVESAEELNHASPRKKRQGHLTLPVF